MAAAIKALVAGAREDKSMTDYSQMSDFEINKAVADIAMNGTWHLRPEHPENKTGGWLYGSNGIETNPLPDYCNSPTDGWPIIIENKIAIIPDSADGEWVAFNEFTLCEGDWMFASDPERHVNGSNPLRAAMIVFLMMKGAIDAPAI